MVFGAGSIAQLPAELDRLGAKRALVLSTPEQALSRKSRQPRQRAAGVYDKAAMHVPVEVAEDARRVARELGADCCVTVGGGSTTGLGKAIALTSPLPILAVPTTYAGSEMTPIYGLTEGGAKKTGRDPRVLPKTVIYDPSLTLGLPPGAFRGQRHERHRALRRGAVRPRRQPDRLADGRRGHSRAGGLAESDMRTTIEARSDALYGAWLAASRSARPGWRCTTSCATCSAAFDLPHAETHSIVLPHAMRYNRGRPGGDARIERAMGAADAPTGSSTWRAAWNADELADIGMKEADLERAARIATEAPYPNPRKVEYAPVLELLRSAYRGQRPAPS